jgi:hypothetical protein
VIALSLAATELARDLALPLFLGGVAVLALGVRASCRRWELRERLLLDPDAYEIGEVHNRADQLATLKERRRLAASVRFLLEQPRTGCRARVEDNARELAELARELDDEHLVLEPICAARCRLLVTDTVESPLLNPDVPSDGLRIAVARVRAGFGRRK